MSEEMNKREPELNEAALNDVSGGRDDYAAKTTHICFRCGYLMVSCKHTIDLLEYLKKNGIDSVSNPSNCPFYGK